MENKNLPTIRQSTEVALSRANTLMDVADKILANQSTDLVDESWMERLWQWADDNECDRYLPKDRESLLNLTYLFIGSVNSKKLNWLPKEIGNLVNLTALHLEGIPLTELPKEIGNLVNLIDLHIGINQYKTIPKQIGNLINLKNLFIDLRVSNINKLPKEIGNLKNLTSFVLQGRGVEEDHIKTLPKEIGNLNNLTHLTLTCTRLTELPKEIGNLVNLRHLTLEGNFQLNELPKEIVNLDLTVFSFDRPERLTERQKKWFDNIESTNLY